MPKEKDPEKQKLIRKTARRLFAGREGKAASMRDLAQAVGMTVSNLYTYYDCRARIIQDIVDEAWTWFQSNCEKDLEGVDDPVKCFRAFTGTYLTELLADKDLIALILEYPETLGDISAKLDFIRSMTIRCRDADAKKPSREAVALFVLGAMTAVSFNAHSNLNINEKDILNCLRDILRPEEYSRPG